MVLSGSTSRKRQRNSSSLADIPTPRPKRQKSKKAAGSDKMTLRNAPVPLPEILHFNTTLSAKKAANQSAQNQESKFQLKAAQRAENWNKRTPTFKVANFRLSQVEGRVKNADADVAAADVEVANMKDIPADACSAKFVDEDGKTLVCVFANRLPEFTSINAENEKMVQEDNGDEDKGDGKEDEDEDEDGEDDAGDDEDDGGAGDQEAQTSQVSIFYPGSTGRTEADILIAKDKYWDGIPTNALARYHEASQELHSFLPPIANKRDVRHTGADIMHYSTEIAQTETMKEPEYVREGVDSAEEIQSERAGVTHLVHAWHQQGHPNDPMTHSRDMAGRGTCKGQVGVRRYFVATRPVAIYIKACFKVGFPSYYKKYCRAFEAGRWITEDPGPWLGRAIVWKLPVETHVDGLDDGPTAIFNCGHYTGGALNLPDIGVKLQYSPGSIVILLSGHLYHNVSEWEPAQCTPQDKVTPGRIGNVFFFPKASFDKLVGRKADWNRDTLSGTLPDVNESKPS